MEKKNSFTYKLSAEQQTLLKELLEGGNYRPQSVPHTILAVKTEDCIINLYTSGKLLIQGKGAEDFVLFFLEPMILGTAEVGYEKILKPESVAPHIGIDESGKGDFFGPLVVGAAYTDEDLSRMMQAMGVKDCKKLGDKQVMEIGKKLRMLLGPERYRLVSIGPEAYNRLYAKIRNVNSLLAWAHARAIENLLEGVPDCPRAVADKFGAESVIKRALMKKGKKIVLEQRHKAEDDIAVAAASILAREAFLFSLKKMTTEFGVQIPKGVSDKVRTVATEMVQKHGPEVLTRVAKCHFRTTDQVLASAGSSRAALGPLGAATSRHADENSDNNASAGDQ